MKSYVTNMKKYNFDEIIDRRGTNALKIEGCKAHFGESDVMPMWLADMDFKTPDFIINAITERCQHEVLGYTLQPEILNIEALAWIERKHGVKFPLEWINFTPSIVSTLAISTLAFTEKGDNIIIQSPIYHPFMDVVKNNDRNIAFNPLIEKDGKYLMDYEELKTLAKDKRTKLMLLCNPHNPGGRVWSKEELKTVAEICKKNNVIVISDGIHADLTLYDNKFTSFLSVSEEAKEIGVELFSPSKTFNIAGIGTGLNLIANKEIRQQLHKQMVALNACYGSMFAYTSMIAAYENGDEWLSQLKLYLENNLDFAIEFIKKELPEIGIMKPEASFLLWLDFEKTGKTDDEINDILIHKTKIAMNPGKSFGLKGEGFQRLNFGCPQATLKIALEKIAKAFS